MRAAVSVPNHCLISLDKNSNLHMQGVDTIIPKFTCVVLALCDLEVGYNQPAVVQAHMMPDFPCVVVEL